jgi:hypothetical protein
MQRTFKCLEFKPTDGLLRSFGMVAAADLKCDNGYEITVAQYERGPGELARPYFVSVKDADGQEAWGRVLPSQDPDFFSVTGVSQILRDVQMAPAPRPRKARAESVGAA